MKKNGSEFASDLATPGDRRRSLAIVRRALAIAAALAAIAYSGVGGAQALPSDFGTSVEVAPGICGTSAIALSSASCKKSDQNNLEIGANGCGPSVYVDKSFVGTEGFNTITIDSGATLCFPDQSQMMDVSAILVNGLLQVGQQTHPIGTTDAATIITINFVGKRPCAAGTNCSGFSKGIQVQAGGSLEMYGLRGVPPNGLNSTYLSLPAGPPKDYGKGAGVTVPVMTDAASTLRLADDVTQGTGAWRKGGGDWIAVGSTSFSPYDTEIVKILKITSKPADNPTGSDVFLATPLVHYHFGSTAPTPSQLCTVNNVPTYVACGSVTGCTSPCTSQPSPLNYNDPAAQNYGVDERAPVALLSRNIMLTSTIAGTDAANIHWGGEMKFLGGAVGAPLFNEVSIQGVEMQKFGKDQLGSYPIHFHIDGDVSKAKTLVDSNSIDHSYNKCVAVHSTQNLTISNTVCVRAVGHLFYEEIGDEKNIAFQSNLGIGAMSNSFDINKTDKFSRDDLIKKYWWTGDYLTNGSMDDIGYDGFNVPDMDATSNPTHGSCTLFGTNGGLPSYVPPYLPPATSGACPPSDTPANTVYIEPASGFWIVNPTAQLINNVIDGCQGVGVGYWYVPPNTQIPQSPFQQVNNNQYLPVGTFRNNRVSACFDGLFGEGAYSESSSSLLHPTVDGTPATRNILAEFDGLTASRIRDRGVWMRDQWFVVNNGRFATSRDSASLLTAGGIDGATPGDWMLLENSVFEGISQNNVDRFGPCPLPNTTFSTQIQEMGCVDQTPPEKDKKPHSGDEIGKGYPTFVWNMFGYLIYDGPARLIHDRFVNFLKEPKLTTTDAAALTAYGAAHPLKDINENNVNWVYEGDAALGWFQSNQSSYPTVANTSQLSFVNTDLRHQVYTQLVNLGKAPGNPSSGFGDGDQNTSVVDLDGTLAGFSAADASNNVGTRFDAAHPISLNGLVINATSNSVDECQAEGAQDFKLEIRPTALMSPSSMATLELQMLYPPSTIVNPPPPGLQKQAITFTKDAVDFGTHGSMTLTSRNGLGVWEPKVTSGLSYTVTAAIDTMDQGTLAGIGKVISLGIVDAYKPDISPTNPFYARVGVCYASANGKPASASSFTIARGYHAYGGGAIKPTFLDPELRIYFNQLVGLYPPSGPLQDCYNLVGNNLLPVGVPINLQCPSNPVPPGCPYSPDMGITFYAGCPANGITLASQGCPSGTTMGTDTNKQAVCVYPTDTLVSTANLSDITNPDGTYNSTPDMNGRTGLDKYYYDPTTGWLFLYVAQQDANPVGPSPLGSCKDAATPDPSCPNNANGETYYVCPPEGCRDYVITVTDSSYKPGVSTCPDPYAAGFGAPEPTPLYHLTLAGTTTTVVRDPILNPPMAPNMGVFSHYAPNAATTPACEATP
jgi:G8 domain